MPIIDKTDGKLDEVREFADTIGLREQLEKQLEYLAGYANGGGCLGPTRCYLFKDFVPQSFYFVMERKLRPDEMEDPLAHRKHKRGPSDDPEWEYWFSGGAVFHGPHDGGGDGGSPTFCVSMNPCHGWQVHT